MLLLVKEHYTQCEMESVSAPFYQLAGCSLDLGGQRASVVVVYRSPDSDSREDDELLSLLLDIARKSPRILLIGDFNAPTVCWNTEYAPTKSFGYKLLEFIHEQALQQHIRDPTRFREGQSPSLLDLVISQFPNDVEHVETDMPIAKSDHLTITFKWKLREPKTTIRNNWKYWKTDIKGLTDSAQSLSWIPSDTEASVDEHWELIKGNILKLRDRYVPIAHGNHRASPPWWRNSITKALKKKGKLWARYLHNGSHRDYDLYRQARSKVDKLKKTCRTTYEKRLADSAKTNPKGYYRYVQSKATLRSKVGSLKRMDQLLTHSIDKANLLVEYFEQVHRPDNALTTASSYWTNTSVPAMTDICVSEEKVLRLLQSANVNKSIGVDGLHPLLVRSLAECICPAVTNLFKLSLRSGQLPKDWKTATVTPIHKGGKKEDAGNYRPVSQTSILLKIMEKLLREHIAEHLTEHGLISLRQHGFTRGRSCLSNLLAFLDEVTTRLDNGEDVEVCYMDFRKAFDSVNHRLLLMKLKGFGLNGNLLTWIQNFLIGRTFHVTVDGERSREAKVLSGVPQGSVLGPLLFLLFVNDLADQLVCPSFLFADDLKLIGNPKTQATQGDLDIIYQWTVTWDLPLNLTKCKRLTQLQEGINTRYLGTTDPTALERVDQMRDLGIQVTSDFKPRTQCLQAAKKANTALHQLKRAVCSRDSKILLPLYTAFVRPHLEYCVQAWAPYLVQDLNTLEDPQKRFTRWFKHLRDEPYEVRLKKLGLFSMSRRRMRGDLIETFKIMNGFVDINRDTLFSLSDQTQLRGHTLKLAKEQSTLDLRLNFFTLRVVNNWNKLPQRVINAKSVDHFKQLLDNCWEEVFPDYL